MKEYYSLLEKLLLSGLIIFCSILPSMAKSFSFGNLQFITIDETSVSVSKCATISGALEIPAQVTCNGNIYSVTSIRERAFYNCLDMTSVTIPNSVTSIGNYAFFWLLWSDRSDYSQLSNEYRRKRLLWMHGSTISYHSKFCDEHRRVGFRCLYLETSKQPQTMKNT